ncbi:hypothetical protein BT63DRAFT_167200 [Microthyrium microscopicum]|uniref:Uncharacterized protein n=1 Tax=Microthyrium microscopicum TaxID=703497 RepID=A0A6A6UQ03_9PEZI|nr:hypothetical protein BT63DRAFT_167200 [Microthyrium microscopicum]
MERATYSVIPRMSMSLSWHNLYEEHDIIVLKRQYSALRSLHQEVCQAFHDQPSSSIHVILQGIRITVSLKFATTHHFTSQSSQTPVQNHTVQDGMLVHKSLNIKRCSRASFVPTADRLTSTTESSLPKLLKVLSSHTGREDYAMGDDVEWRTRGGTRGKGTRACIVSHVRYVVRVRRRTRATRDTLQRTRRSIVRHVRYIVLARCVRHLNIIRR